MLVQDDIQVPYILVGYSLGSLIMLYYASMHPEKVAGIVLVDSDHEKQQTSYAKSLIKKYIMFIKIMLSLSFLGALLLLSLLIIRNTKFPQKIIKQYRCLMATRKAVKASLAEITAYSQRVPEFIGSLKSILHDLPLVVITHGKENNKNINNELDKTQKNLQQEFLALSTRSKQIIAKNSSHYVQWTEPELIVDAIRWIK